MIGKVRTALQACALGTSPPWAQRARRRSSSSTSRFRRCRSPNTTARTSPCGSKARIGNRGQPGRLVPDARRSHQVAAGPAPVVAPRRPRPEGARGRSDRRDAARRPAHPQVQCRAEPLAKLAPGKYKLVVEAVREVGGREAVRIPFEWPIKAAQAVQRERHEGARRGRAEAQSMNTVPVAGDP